MLKMFPINFYWPIDAWGFNKFICIGDFVSEFFLQNVKLPFAFQPQILNELSAPHL